MKIFLTTLFVTISGIVLSAHTLTFGTSADNNGTLTGQNTNFSIKQSEGITCLIKNTETFGTARYQLKTYTQNENETESLDQTMTVDVHEKWSWTTIILVYNDKNSGDYKYRVALFDMKGKQLCESILNVNIKTEGAVFIDQNKLEAYGGIWDAMMFSTTKAEISVIGGAAKKGDKAGSRSTISLADGKEIQVAVHAAGSYTFPEGKITFNYTLSTNTTGKPDVTSDTAVTAGKDYAVHNVKLKEGQWKVSVMDANGVEIAAHSFTITR